jgi:large subunit ribosomal protein L34
MQPTYRPSKRRRTRQHGFRARSKSKGGKATIKRRRKIGRKRLVAKNIKKYKRHRET